MSQKIPNYILSSKLPYNDYKEKSNKFIYLIIFIVGIIFGIVLGLYAL